MPKNLGSDTCEDLPGLHAFKGFGYTAALTRKGKVCMLSKVDKSKKFQQAFGQLGESKRVSSVTMFTLETFVCHIYNGKPISEQIQVCPFPAALCTKERIKTTSRNKGSRSQLASIMLLNAGTEIKAG